MPRLLQTALSFTLLCAGANLLAQTSPAGPTTPYFNRNLIVLDPAHGGQDAGPSLNGRPEKAITLSLSSALRASLIVAGFTVVSTRETDLPDSAPLLTSDQRAGIANHLRPAACIIFHATGTGSGIHLTTSSLTQSDGLHDTGPLPWETLQDDYIDRSQRLSNDLGLALVHAKIPTLLIHATLRPLDNLTCPAVAIEVAPLSTGSRSTPVTDAGYQQRLADTLAAAILTWRDATSPRPPPKAITPPTGGATP